MHLQKKILFITNVPAPYTVDFFNELGKKVDLTVLYERPKADNRKTEWFSNKETNYKAICMNGRKVGVETAICINVVKYISSKYDLIIVGDYSSPTGILAIIYMVFRKLPFFIHADGGMTQKESKWRYFIKKRLLSSASGYFSSGANTDKYFKYYGKPEAPCFRYPFTSLRKENLCSKVLTKKEKQAFRNDTPYKEETIALYVGRVIKGKGIDTLLEAARTLPPSIGIHIVGGEPTQELEKYIEQNNIENVQFHPFSSFNQILEIMKIADCFVFPTRGDVWGLVVNEAMSQGLPVITTDQCVAGLELIQESINGFVIPSNDSSALAEKILYFNNNSEEAFWMGEHCLEKIKEYTIENMAEVYSRYITNYCDKVKG